MTEQLAVDHGDIVRRALGKQQRAFFALLGAPMFGVAVVATLALVNGRALDRHARHASIEVMAAAVDERAGQLDGVVEAHARSNEAVAAIQLRQDRAWAAADMGSDLYGSYEYDWAFVIAPGGSTFVAARQGEAVADDITKALGNERWRPLVERARAAVTGTGPIAVHAHVPMREKQLGIISAAAFMPETSWTAAPPAGAPYVLVVVRRLDGSSFAELAEALGLSDLAFDLSAAPPATGLRLAGADGRPVGSMSWQARRPGTEYLVGIAPAFGVVLVLVLAFMWRARQLSRK